MVGIEVYDLGLSVDVAADDGLRCCCTMLLSYVCGWIF